MQNFISNLQSLPLYLWLENGGAVISSIIVGIIFIISKFSWTQQNKPFYLFVWFFQFIANIPSVLNSALPWYERVYCGMLSLYGLIMFIDVARTKKDHTFTLNLTGLVEANEDGSAPTIDLDAREMFRKSAEGAKKGSLPDICNLGYFYRQGTGVQPNLLKSKHYFEQLCASSDPFWREHGKEQLDITNKMIEEQKKDIKKTAAEQAGNVFKSYMGVDN